MQIQNEGLIDKNAESVFQRAIAVEDYPQFAHNYLISQISEFNQNRPLINRTAEVNKKPVSWQTELISFTTENHLKKLHFKQVTGPLAGMEVHWSISPSKENSSQTTLKIIHLLETESFSETKQSDLNKFFEQDLKKIADQFIIDFKQWCEKKSDPEDQILSFLAEAFLSLNRESNYADVHKGPFMKNRLGNLDLSPIIKNRFLALPVNALFKIFFKISPTVKKFREKYSEQFPVYGLLSRTFAYQDLISSMQKFILATRKKYFQEQALSTLELHTGTGNATSEFLIPVLNQGTWITTDREIHNYKHICRALDANKISYESLFTNYNHDHSKVYVGTVDLARFPKTPHLKVDEIIANMGGYFGTAEQTLSALQKMNQILKKGGLLFISGYVYPHQQPRAIKSFIKYHFNSKNFWFSLCFGFYVWLTTKQWGKDIASEALYLINLERLKSISTQCGFKIVNNLNLSEEIGMGDKQSEIWAFALQKTN